LWQRVAAGHGHVRDYGTIFDDDGGSTLVEEIQQLKKEDLEEAIDGLLTFAAEKVSR